MDKVKKESVVISVALSQDMVNDLDRMASSLRVTPNKLIGNFIVAGFDEIKILQKLNLLKKIWALQSFLKQYGIDVTKKRVDNIERSRAMTISIRMERELNEELDTWAKDFGRTKSSLIESCLGLTIENYKDDPKQSKVNLLKLIDTIRENIHNTKKLLEKWKKRSKVAKEISNEIFNLAIE